ncbi:hypothetical protein DENSPDRAFT_54576 [Dentipellis sp. KUC8613]|nr:hypothetical protein DENSPDRAFT_54576 [Dentipellis sp. KUC8613]
MSRFDEGYYAHPNDVSYRLFCRNCRRTDHEQRDCDQPPRCYTCGMLGHLQFECEDTQCANCHEFGHMVDRCWKPIICYHCNVENHFARDCRVYIPNPVEEARQALEEGYPARAIFWYTEAIETNHLESVFYAGRAKAYMLLEKYALARKDLEDLISLESGRVSNRAYMDLAWCNGTLGDVDNALFIIDEEVLAEDPENLEAWDLRERVSDLALQRRHHDIYTGSIGPMRWD